MKERYLVYAIFGLYQLKYTVGDRAVCGLWETVSHSAILELDETEIRQGAIQKHLLERRTEIATAWPSAHSCFNLSTSITKL